MVNSMTYSENGTKSISYINALAKAKREMKKIDYDEMQTIDVANFVSHEYLLNKEEQAALEKSLEKYVEKMNKIYSLPFEEFCKWVERGRKG